MKRSMLLAALLVAACAHEQTQLAGSQRALHGDADAFVHDMFADYEPATYSLINGYSPPQLISCNGEAPLAPPEVFTGALQGMVPVTFLIGPDGRIGQIHSESAHVSPKLLASTRAWLQSCQYQPATFFGHPVAVQWNDVFAFTLAMDIPLSENEPLDATGAELPNGVTAPRLAGCDAPNLAAPQLVTFVVHSDGTVSDLTPAANVSPSPEAMKLLRAWLATCRIEPAKKYGEPIAARWRIQPWPGGAYDEPPVTFVDASAPVPDCETIPEPPMRARRAAVDGVVLVSYLVQSDGRITRVMRLNDAPPVLYQAVRAWLLSCHHKPAIDALGRAIPAKVVMPFHFVYRPQDESASN